MMKFDAPEFYPTPEKLLKKITEETFYLDSEVNYKCYF